MPSSISKMANGRELQIAIATISATLTNFWVYRLFHANILLGTLLILESFFLFLSLFLKSKVIISLSFIILICLGIFLVKNYFDKTVFIPTEMESIQKIRNREYYANELGKIYRNRAGLFYFDELRLYLHKLNYKLFSFFDIRIYFGFDNNLNLYYPVFFFPFFIFGFIYLLMNPKIILVTYTCLALFLNIFISSENNLGPVLLFPFLNVLIGLGFIQTAKFLKYLLS